MLRTYVFIAKWWLLWDLTVSRQCYMGVKIVVQEQVHRETLTLNESTNMNGGRLSILSKRSKSRIQRAQQQQKHKMKNVFVSIHKSNE